MLISLINRSDIKILEVMEEISAEILGATKISAVDIKILEDITISVGDIKILGATKISAADIKILEAIKLSRATNLLIKAAIKIFHRDTERHNMEAVTLGAIKVSVGDTDNHRAGKHRSDRMELNPTKELTATALAHPQDTVQRADILTKKPTRKTYF